MLATVKLTFALKKKKIEANFFDEIFFCFLLTFLFQVFQIYNFIYFVLKEKVH